MGNYGAKPPVSAVTEARAHKWTAQDIRTKQLQLAMPNKLFMAHRNELLTELGPQRVDFMNAIGRLIVTASNNSKGFGAKLGFFSVHCKAMEAELVL